MTYWGSTEEQYIDLLDTYSCVFGKIEMVLLAPEDFGFIRVSL